MKSFYAQKKILLTGHTTFMGSWMSLLLYSLGADVTGCSIHPPTEPNLFREADIEELIRSYIGDVRDPDFLHTMVRQHEPDILLHLSAVDGFCDSIAPRELYGMNMLGVLNALEVCRQSDPVHTFINIVPDYSKEHFFNTCEKKKQGEMELTIGSFRSTEFLTTGYRNAYFYPNEPADTPAKSVFNVRTLPVIGGGDWSIDNRLRRYLQVPPAHIPVGIRAAQNTHYIYMLHVLDALTGCLEVLQQVYEERAGVMDYKVYPENGYLRNEQWVAAQLARLAGQSHAGDSSSVNIQQPEHHPELLNGHCFMAESFCIERFIPGPLSDSSSLYAEYIVLYHYYQFIMAESSRY